MHLISVPAAGTSRSARPFLVERHALLSSGLPLLLDADEDIETLAQADDLEAALPRIHGERLHVLACGTLGFVLKDRVDDELASAVRAAAREEEYVSQASPFWLDASLRRPLAG